MKCSGFTFVRNAIKFDYPVIESINSILPLCDELIIAVGNSEDETLNLIKSIGSPKIKIIETIWDDSLRQGGKVLSVETNKALASVSEDSDWAFYIQADEVIHEKYLENIYNAMLHWKAHKSVEGLLFKYLHFYGSYDYVGESYRWYRREVRIIRNNNKINSYKDAQGFRYGGSRKLNVKLIDAFVYHYGWVKIPKAMQEKQKQFNLLWHAQDWVEKNIINADEFDYSNIDALCKFQGTHPEVMKDRIAKKNWSFEYDISINKYSNKEKFKRFLEKLTGKRIGEYRNYKII